MTLMQRKSPLIKVMNEQYMDQARRSWEYKAKKRSVRVKTV